MIHELNHLNGKQVLSENLLRNLMALTDDLQNKEVMVALSKVVIF